MEIAKKDTGNFLAFPTSQLSNLPAFQLSNFPTFQLIKQKAEEAHRHKFDAGTFSFS